MLSAAGGTVAAVLPLEYLRHLARQPADAGRHFLEEVAACLGEFEHDPSDLVMACRRLLAHQRANAPLWWMCARICAAPRPRAAATEAARVLSDDQTGPRLAGALPFPHDGTIAVFEWPDAVADAVASRPDLDVVAVATPADARSLRRRLRFEEAFRTAATDELPGLAPSHFLVEALAASRDTVLLPDGGRRALDALPATTQAWIVIRAGRLLPDRLFEALQQASALPSEQVVGLERADRLATPDGVRDAADGPGVPSCPVPPELLRPF
ncbi:MAG: hypothetical protein U0V73_10165 [Acidimicrobiia bacterium]